MKYRRYNEALLVAQENMRKELIVQFQSFDISNLNLILSKEELINSLIGELEQATKGGYDEVFFKNYRYLLDSIFHLLKWGQKEITAISGSEVHLKAAKANARQIQLDGFNQAPDFKKMILEIIQMVERISEINEIKAVLTKFNQMAFPTIFEFEVDPYAKIKGLRSDFSERKNEEDEKPLILSLQLTVEGEPWANPQVLKPEELYAIKGKLVINYWPKGFNRLVLKPVSTFRNNWFDLSIPIIEKSNKSEYEFEGYIAFKYPQNNLDQPISIKLLTYYENQTGRTLLPTIIGYDQLIAKILDPNSTRFLTGFKKMNRLVYEIENLILKELPKIDMEELEDFLSLLTGILNYQGFCLQQGIYKNEDGITEDEFRDKLIQHLIGLPYLGENIVKESHLAGGRVEVIYKGIVAELKVEKKNSERDKLIEKYGKQPIAYASGNSKQFSIICILDLTDKKLPPATPQNSVKLITPKLHGFETSLPEYPSKQVLVIIDGNTKKPSDYSK